MFDKQARPGRKSGPRKRSPTEGSAAPSCRSLTRHPSVSISVRRNASQDLLRANETSSEGVMRGLHLCPARELYAKGPPRCSRNPVAHRGQWTPPPCPGGGSVVLYIAGKHPLSKIREWLRRRSFCGRARLLVPDLANPLNNGRGLSIPFRLNLLLDQELLPSSLTSALNCWDRSVKGAPWRERHSSSVPGFLSIAKLPGHPP